MKPCHSLDASDMTIRAMWLAGKPRYEIAETVGLHVNTVRERALRMGLPAHPKATWTALRKVTPAEVARFKSMRDAGATLKDIAQATGRGMATIHNAVNGRIKSEVQDEPRVTVPQARLELREKLYELQYIDLTSALMGDPVPGRRELLEQYA